MKKWVSGLIVGAILASSTVVGASSNYLQVQDTSTVKFNFNGYDKTLPDGYKVLMYQDRTYVPARFVADNMGGNVDWDQANQTVIVKNQVGDVTGARVYATLLPISSEVKQYMIDVLQVRSDLFVDDSAIQANFFGVASGGSSTQINLQYSLASVEKLKLRSGELQTFLRDHYIREDIINDFKIMTDNIDAIFIAMTHEQGAIITHDAGWTDKYMEMNKAIMTLSIQNKQLIEKYEGMYHQAETDSLSKLQSALH